MMTVTADPAVAGADVVAVAAKLVKLQRAVLEVINRLQKGRPFLFKHDIFVPQSFQNYGFIFQGCSPI